jgi:hypothetical protein
VDLEVQVGRRADRVAGGADEAEHVAAADARALAGERREAGQVRVVEVVAVVVEQPQPPPAEVVPADVVERAVLHGQERRAGGHEDVDPLVEARRRPRRAPVVGEVVGGGAQHREHVAAVEQLGAARVVDQRHVGGARLRGGRGGRDDLVGRVDGGRPVAARGAGSRCRRRGPGVGVAHEDLGARRQPAVLLADPQVQGDGEGAGRGRALRGVDRLLDHQVADAVEHDHPVRARLDRLAGHDQAVDARAQRAARVLADDRPGGGPHGHAVRGDQPVEQRHPGGARRDIAAGVLAAGGHVDGGLGVEHRRDRGIGLRREATARGGRAATGEHGRVGDRLQAGDADLHREAGRAGLGRRRCVGGHAVGADGDGGDRQHGEAHEQRPDPCAHAANGTLARRNRGRVPVNGESPGGWT